MTIQRSNVVKIHYTNHAGVRSMRKIIPGNLEFGNNEWHPETQWLLNAYDVDKDDVRTFAMTGIHSWNPECNEVKAECVDASIAKHLQSSIERNSRMVMRLKRLAYIDPDKENLETTINKIINDEEPAWIS